MMKSILIVPMVLFTMFGLAVVAEGIPFPEGYKPEENVPGWVTRSPYQRNVFLDFSVDPQCIPGSGIPGADYEGTDDPLLWDTDFVSFDPYGAAGCDDVQWFETDPYGSGRTGLIGVPEQTPGVFPWLQPQGVLNIHIDNWDRAEPYEKHFWITIVAKGYLTDAGLSGFPNVKSSNSEEPPWLDSYGDGPMEDLGDGWFKRSYWGVIKPNPLWEEFQFFFINTNPDYPGPILLDSVHIATECVVPEPGTILMILGGLAGIAGIVRRRK